MSKSVSGFVGMSWRTVNFLGMLVLIALIALWQILEASHVFTLQSLPTPAAIISAAGTLIGDGQFQSNIGHTVFTLLAGWVIGSLIGLLVGLILGLLNAAYDYSMASVDLLRAVPAVTLVPLSVLFFGFSSKMEIVLIAFVSIWSVLVATVDGTRNCPEGLIDVARSMRMSYVNLVRKVIIPQALPKIVVALRIGLAVALAIAVLSELVGNPHGIGAALAEEEQGLEPARMFAYVIAASLVGLVLNAILVGAVRILSPGTSATMARQRGGR